MASQRMSLSVPPIQNTAPVIKFQCLFTHDIRRKAKRWQDGFLRFHTFNKRVMVYDTTGNLVGDLHWRDRDMLQDGDEFELERGILVQAGEQLESTVTDLTGLLEKRKSSPAKPDHSQSRPRNANVGRPNDFKAPFPSSGSSMKSLNEVLGIKKSTQPTRVIRSPYVERERLNKSICESEERPAKKRKPSPESDTEEPSRLSPSPPPRPTRGFKPQSRPNVEEPVTNSKPRKASDAEPRAPGGVTDLCNKISNESNRPGFASASTASFRPASAVEPEPISTKDRRKKSSGKASANQMSLTSMFGNVPTTTLEVAPRRPRNQLIFVDKLAEQLAKAREKRKLAENNTVMNSESSKRADTLKAPSALMPRDKNITSFQSKEQLSIDGNNDGEAPRVQQKATSLLGFFKPAAVTTQGQEIQHDDGEEATVAEPKPSRPMQNIQRSLSVTDSMPVNTTGSAKAPALEAPVPHVESGVQNAQPKKHGPLERSISDSSALNPPRSLPKKRVIQTRLFPDRILSLPAIDEPEVEVEQGPWTSEALDLFDWWPPDRPKPTVGSIPI
ncbi:hypothetical protein H112_04168 [Trichophyton rubrum D6]|uniref:5'-3' DNA helicase ZGRF1-like N-terminal domain-containing protein n=4 Tax=Trichophyton TaxID=5550 RepID=A0A178F4M5_TRIRU|nr:uncharacterized protein TERG_03944 [Trichophyton rubrum CBS 118892]EZF23086.1 hypothetical protein H100_04172 [Trichophyton rubrum MR850]EZF42148.1 hypothetical protein H102_04160 [Trichophyton rubrum CBS 100081]EZF52803.1 hypothetical protein H103_04172 [Trichophyton rubrum CBS 288.86]EZF63407.1 hypothetical protein H104_04158 [Trichophyton rubrum CBS 289.86]EZF74087.1 hypothetical protein H105_04189 [Trichophyton soudanense CBS 452.61]EZF84714.1 hypothetical protein H110_04165 [Trichophy